MGFFKKVSEGVEGVLGFMWGALKLLTQIVCIALSLVLVIILLTILWSFALFFLELGRGFGDLANTAIAF